MVLLTAISWGLSAFILLLATFFLLQVGAAALVASKKKSSDGNEPPVDLKAPTAFLIPAHNEADVIEATLASIVTQLQPHDEVVVVADNCIDETVELARKYKVTVLERHNLNDKGKGYALDYGLNYLAKGESSVVIMVDADCILEDGARDRLVGQVLATGKPVQALYLMKNKSESPNVSQKISEFAWLIKNKIRPMGSKAMRGPCQLMGTGMAFPAEVIYNAELASGCIVEDMKLGLDLAVAGHGPRFVPEAVVVSYFPEASDVGEGQRSRWIQGHMDMIIRYTPKLLFKFLTTFDVQRLLMLLDLLVPPLVLFLLSAFATFFFAILVSILTGSSGVLLSVIAILFLLEGIYLCWLIEGKEVISGSELWRGFFVALKKLSLYTHFFTNKRKEWNKTSRK